MKKRIDIILTEKNLAKSREKAKTLIIAGNVSINNIPVKNPSETYEEDVLVVVKQDDCPYVSRGGLKLEKAIKEFEIDLKDKVCLDIGASTGGFTHCMLLNGAKHVFAVDVGYGQFDWSLRNNENVSLFERTNARYLEPFSRAIDFVSIDVSFISLRLIFPTVKRICEDAYITALIKPQFEAGRSKVGKKGVVKEKSTHIEVIENVVAYGKENDFHLNNLTFSPIKGPNGNIEYLGYFSKNHSQNCIDITAVVDISHGIS